MIVPSHTYTWTAKCWCATIGDPTHDQMKKSNIYYNNWNARTTHIWSKCSHSNTFIHFHHLLLGAKVNQCASVQQPTNLHLAPILIWEKNRKKARCFSKKPCVDQSYSHFFNYIHLQNLMKLQVSAVNTYPVSPNLYLWHWHCCWLLHRAGFRWLGMMRPDRSKEAPMEWDGIEGAPTEVNGCQL